MKEKEKYEKNEVITCIKDCPYNHDPKIAFTKDKNYRIISVTQSGIYILNNKESQTFLYFERDSSVHYCKLISDHFVKSTKQISIHI